MMFNGIFGESILKRAQEKGIVEIHCWDLRSFTEDKHRTVDDYPYGGGAGMVLKPEPIFRAVEAIPRHERSQVILMSPQGPHFSQEMAVALKGEGQLIFICGHYRGIDERVNTLIDREISIGDYIVTGGELPAAVVIDAVARLLPGVLGDQDSAAGDSISTGMLDYPHYTRPQEFRGMKVPEVLLSGHHANVEAWRRKKALEKTEKKRPDLLNDK
jgi:tRNA (guanine37-N1)-methyltransferase